MLPGRRVSPGDSRRASGASQTISWRGGAGGPPDLAAASAPRAPGPGPGRPPGHRVVRRRDGGDLCAYCVCPAARPRPAADTPARPTRTSARCRTGHSTGHSRPVCEAPWWLGSTWRAGERPRGVAARGAGRRQLPAGPTTSGRGLTAQIPEGSPRSQPGASTGCPGRGVVAAAVNGGRGAPARRRCRQLTAGRTTSRCGPPPGYRRGRPGLSRVPQPGASVGRPPRRRSRGRQRDGGGAPAPGH
ncbi:hypothetical protein GA0115240_107035 [Streptomyces sp. DvalAA-14]|nr:hypothetical protein GA0115240_107035 [Streptomyces sp. DvalAA-14]